ncbi:hypothetical protein J3Q64DRAFT_1713275 [Phycomyces blakesleeanus]|uniref:Secreted protein n=1 Tax=Phycomyces blakesleeanus TaxID=4837 RepID=A0ABR3BEW6_PHYBL
MRVYIPALCMLHLLNAQRIYYESIRIILRFLSFDTKFRLDRNTICKDEKMRRTSRVRLILISRYCPNVRRVHYFISFFL